MSRSLKALVVLIAATAAVWITAVPAHAQDTHYWTDQYGARSMLLSGSVIGSVNDMSAVFYNPGALGYLPNPELLLSANAFQLRKLTIEGGGGAGLDLDSSDFNPIPNLFAVAFRFNFHGRNKLAFSVLTRYHFQAEIKGSRTAEFDANPDVPGDEEFAGGLFRSNSVSEVWVGLTWARALRERIGFGVTTFLSVRNQDNVGEFLAQAQSQTGELALLLGLDNYEAGMYGLLWKAGLGFDFRPLTAGISVTTPTLGVAGSGTSSLNLTSVGIDLDGDSVPDNRFTTNIQKDVTANNKTPWAVGVGAAWHLKNSKLHVAVEWFSKVDGFDVLELEPFVSQSGDTLYPSLRHRLDSVVNFALGYEYIFGDTYSGYLGFNTDMSAFNPESGVATTPYDIYHVAAGGRLALTKVRLMLGFRYAWGSEAVQQIFDLPTGDVAGVLADGTDVVLRFSELDILVGFSWDI